MKRTPRFSSLGEGLRASTATRRPSASRRSTIVAEKAGAAGDKNAHSLGIALVAFGGRGPRREREPVDFGVVPDVDGKNGRESKTS